MTLAVPGRESRHFTSLSIFTSHAEPTLDTFLDREAQIELEVKHREEEDRMYRHFVSRRREEEERVKTMGDEEREAFLFELSREERMRVGKLLDKHCRQMLELIFKAKVDYFSSSDASDFHSIIARSYPRDPPDVCPPLYNKQQVYENNLDVFEEVDVTAMRIAKEESYKLFTHLVRDLIAGYTSDVEKARVIFRFMTERSFEFESWFLYYPEEANKRGAPVQLFRGVEFGLETKAILFKRLCAYAGLHAEVIKGYSKSGSYLPGEEFVDAQYRNSWNAVYVAGGWRLVQCNWGKLSVKNNIARETRKIYQDHYFLTDPDKFIFEFFPLDPEWQLMDQPISMQEFEDLPILRSTFFHYNLGLQENSNLSAVLETDDNGQVTVALLAQPEVSFHYELSFFKSGATIVAHEDTSDMELSRFLLMSTLEDVTSFEFRSPCRDTFLLDIFASVYPSFEECLQEKATKYINVCRFRINCNQVPEKANVPLPQCAPGEWGPAKAVKLAGLLPLSHFLPVINAAPEPHVTLDELKPLTLNMEFEMTRPMLDFIIRLHQTGDQPYSENGKKRDAGYRLKNDKFLLVDIKVPFEGQYGLEIFAREKMDQRMVHICKYLINCDV